MIKFYRKADGGLTVNEWEAQFASHEEVDEGIMVCPVCGYTWRQEYDNPCLCKDVVYMDKDNDFDAREVFDLLQPLVAAAYELDLNPLPALRKLFGEMAKFSYWNGDCYGATMDASMKDVVSGKVMVLVAKDGWCRFW